MLSTRWISFSAFRATASRAGGEVGADAVHHLAAVRSLGHRGHDRGVILGQEGLQDGAVHPDQLALVQPSAARAVIRPPSMPHRPMDLEPSLFRVATRLLFTLPHRTS